MSDTSNHSVPGYQVVAVLHEGGRAVVLRCIRLADSQPVVLKRHASDRTTPEDFARLQREANLLRDLGGVGTPRVVDFCYLNGHWTIVSQDMGGVSLQKLHSNGPLDIKAILDIAIKACDVLTSMHARGVIHKDINPANIVINDNRQDLQLIDFDIATRLDKEQAFVTNQGLEGTIAYISPEQTGRMNRPVDSRADLYALGVTLFELLTRQLPFSGQTPLEIIHGHIAITPTTPKELKPAIPALLSRIIMKLLEKEPSARYQSALGLKHDLRRCLQDLDEFTDIPLGQGDPKGRFEIPRKLYGREAEVAQLLSAFDHAATGSTGLLLVKGSSGIGKSMVVAEIKKPIAAKRGNFIAGKFDQYQQNQPYLPFVQAFRSLVRTFLASSPDELAWWRARIERALGDSPQVIADMVPELGTLLGVLKPVRPLPPLETTNRFRLVFEAFARAVSPREHPLVLFIDDLQWADGASLSLIEILAAESEQQALLVIGAFRDNEVNDTHPLQDALRRLAVRGVEPQVLQVRPLSMPDVSQLVADTLAKAPAAVQDLASLALHKTGGNPFFLAQFLELLYTRGLISFDLQSLQFCYDMQAIAEVSIADNVVDIVLAKLRRLAPEALQAISYAACIGSEFKLAVLAACLNRSLQDTAASLQQAMQQDAIIPLDAAYRLFEAAAPLIEVRYRFSHDRIQQASIKLLSEAELIAAHLIIGRRLKHQPIGSADIFSSVSHLYAARELLETEETLDLATLCLAAGKQAVSGAAYEPAFRLFEIGLAVLGEDAWSKQPVLTMELHSHCVQISHPANLIDDMNRHYGELVAKCKDPHDYFAATRAVIDSLSQRAKHADAISLSLSALAERGIKVRRSVSSFGALKAIIATMWVLPLRSLPSLAQMKAVSDPQLLHDMALIDEALPSAFFQDPNIFAVMCLKSVRMMARDGISEDGVIALTVYAMIRAGAFHDYKGAEVVVQAAIEIAKAFGFRRGMLRAICIGLAFNEGWLHPIRSNTPRLEDLAQDFIAMGDLEFACLAYAGCLTTRILTWEHLGNLVEGGRSWSKVAKRSNQVEARRIIAVFTQFVANLMGFAADPYSLTGEFMDEAELLKDAYEAHDLVAYGAGLALKGALAAYYGNYPAAAVLLKQAVSYRRAIETLPPVYPQLRIVYAAVAMAAEKPGRVKAYLSVFLRLKDYLFVRRISKLNPLSFAWGKYLVEAEIARLLRLPSKAIASFERARNLAAESQYLSAQAFVLERTARYAFEIGNQAYGIAMLVDARKCYADWGANGKATQLAAELRERGVKDAVSASNGPIQTWKSGGSLKSSSSKSTFKIDSELDLESLLKAFQVISGQLDLNTLAADLMRVILQNAGADHGFVILVEPAGLFSRVSGVVDGEIEISVARKALIDMSHELPLSIVNYVKHAAEPFVLDQANTLSGFDKDPYLATVKPRSIACLPIAQQGELMGVLYLENRLVAGAFRPDKVHLLALLAAQGAISLRNTYFVTEVAHRARLENDLEAARAVQDALLPGVGSIPGFNIETFYQPADQTGGDWYDFHYDPVARRAFFQIGDVVGHGVPSALVTGAVCGATSSFHYVMSKSGELSLNETVALWVGAGDHAVSATGSRVGRGMSMFFVAVEIDQGRAAFANAGHRHVLHIQGGDVHTLLASGNPLGSDSLPRIHSTMILPGDRLFFYTDGLIESADPSKRTHGNLRRIMKILARGETLAQTKELILAEWRKTRGEGKRLDDCAFMLVEAGSKVTPVRS